MVAAFLGLRLYSVLGRRAEQEEEPVPQRFESDDKVAGIRPAAMPAPVVAPRPVELEGVMPAVERALREIAAADSKFNLGQFLEGARGAYRMILEAFWNGDRETLRELCDDDVYAGFVGAILCQRILLVSAQPLHCQSSVVLNRFSGNRICRATCQPPTASNERSRNNQQSSGQGQQRVQPPHVNLPHFICGRL